MRTVASFVVFVVGAVVFRVVDELKLAVRSEDSLAVTRASVNQTTIKIFDNEQGHFRPDFAAGLEAIGSSAVSIRLALRSPNMGN